MTNTQSGEAYPVDANGELLYQDGDFIPYGPTNDTAKGGCFGNGPGPLNFTGGSIEMDSRWFSKVPQLYEIMVEVRKDTRKAKNSLLLDVVNGKPPLMEIV